MQRTQTQQVKTSVLLRRIFAVGATAAALTVFPASDAIGNGQGQRYNGHHHNGHGQCNGNGHHGHGHANRPTVLPDVPIGDPVPGLTAAELALFEEGKALFEKEFTPTEGLGPLYNGTSCVACHAHPIVGGSQGSTVDNVTHFGVKDGDRFLEMFEVGGPVAQTKTISGSPQAPTCNIQGDDGQATVSMLGPKAGVSIRHTGAIFGFGLIDAIEDKDILKHQNHRGDADVLGFANFGVELETVGAYTGFSPDLTRTQPFGASRVGRFGWKSQTATLWQFSNEPFNIELGVSSPFFKRENTPDGGAIPPECNVATHQVNDPDSQDSLRLLYFQAFIAPPARGHISHDARKGEKVFQQIGCTDCHAKEYVTAEDYYIPWPDGTAHRVDALSNKRISVFSDFLVHDMGPALADKRTMGRATGRYWRTTPLLGVRHKTNLMHNGSATSIHEAILAHGGEGSASRAAYNNLSHKKRRRLNAFLESL